MRANPRNELLASISVKGLWSMKLASSHLAATVSCSLIFGCAVIAPPGRASVPDSAGQSGVEHGEPRRRDEMIATVKGLPGKLTAVATKLQEVDGRLRRALRTVPTGEEFRKQVAEGRRSIEKRRSGINDLWKEAGRIAQARGVKTAERAIKDAVPAELAQDAEFLAARTRALDEARLVAEFEERLIQVMLTTTFGDSQSVPAPAVDASAIALEWRNLAEHQKILTTAAENARAKAAAAKVEFDPAQLLEDVATPGKTDTALIKAMEQAKVARERRDATAELVATLEFRKAVGPQYKDW